MVGVFAGFVTSSKPVIKSIGFALAVGIFVDAEALAGPARRG